MTHLGARISALVDGELGHEARDRALAHVAHCPTCRDQLDAERAVKAALAAAPAPAPSEGVLASLQALALPGGPLPPRARTMPQGPVVPVLPPPGRAPRGARGDSRGPASYGTGRPRLPGAPPTERAMPPSGRCRSPAWCWVPPSSPGVPRRAAASSCRPRPSCPSSTPRR